MEEKVSKIQELINAKADKRLNDEIDSISRQLRDKWHLLEKVLINVGDQEKPKMVQLCHILTSDGLKGKLFDIHQEQYRSDETKLFVQQVESLRDDVDQLLNP